MSGSCSLPHSVVIGTMRRRQAAGGPHHPPHWRLCCMPESAGAADLAPTKMPPQSGDEFVFAKGERQRPDRHGRGPGAPTERCLGSLGQGCRPTATVRSKSRAQPVCCCSACDPADPGRGDGQAGKRGHRRLFRRSAPMPGCFVESYQAARAGDLLPLSRLDVRPRRGRQGRRWTGQGAARGAAASRSLTAELVVAGEFHGQARRTKAGLTGMCPQ